MATISLDAALANLQTTFTSLTTLVAVVSYVVGVFLVFKGIGMYRIFANQTFGSAQRGEFAGPLVAILVGVVLVYFPSTLDTSLITIFGSADVSPASDLMSYSSLQDSEKWQKLSEIVVKYMKLIGLIAFVRGWIILSKMSQSGTQPGTMGKGLIHIIGGILLINIVDTVNLLGETFGFVETG